MKTEDSNNEIEYYQSKISELQEKIKLLKFDVVAEKKEKIELQRRMGIINKNFKMIQSELNLFKRDLSNNHIANVLNYLSRIGE